MPRCDGFHPSRTPCDELMLALWGCQGGLQQKRTPSQVQSPCSQPSCGPSEVLLQYLVCFFLHLGCVQMGTFTETREALKNSHEQSPSSHRLFLLTHLAETMLALFCWGVSKWGPHCELQCSKRGPSGTPTNRAQVPTGSFSAPTICAALHLVWEGPLGIVGKYFCPAATSIIFLDQYQNSLVLHFLPPTSGHTYD